MENANGARPAAAGAHWLAAAPPNFRARVVGNIMKNLAHVVQEDQLHNFASQYEAKVFSHSDNAQDYLRSISKKMMRFQQRWQPAAQPASSEPQQQAQIGRHQMRPVDVEAAPQVQTLCTSTQQLQPQQRMNQQQDQRQSYQTHNGQHANVAIMQTGQCGGHQLGSPHPAGQVDWREEMFQKITYLKDAHSSELVEFNRAMQAWVVRIEANGQPESLPEDQARQYRYAQHIMGNIKRVMTFLRIQKTNIPDVAKDQLDRLQTTIHNLLSSYREIKAKMNTRRQSQNCHEQPPRAVNMSGATDDSQQNHHEQHAAAEALSHYSSESVPSATPLAQQQNHTEHFAGEAEADDFAGEAEDNSVRDEAESPVTVNLPGDTAPFTGTTCSQEIQQRHPEDEVIPQSTESVEPAGTSPPSQQQTDCIEAEDNSVRAEAETPVSMETGQRMTRCELIKSAVDALRSLSPAALRSLASDMGVNLKRAFRHTTSDTMDGSSSCAWSDDQSSEKRCYKRQKTHGGAMLDDEIRATNNKLVETEIRISEDDTEVAGGTVIELSYNGVSLEPDLKAAIWPSAVSTKLLVPADYPQSSPVILGVEEQRWGVQRVADMSFRRGLALGLLPEPRSIEAMAKAWDTVVRRAILRFARQLGGGTFSTRYGQWESCVPV
ncbi:unnamed protein product [Alopecurus aequalis]